MANLRIVNSNITSISTLSSSGVESLPLDSLKDNIKSNIWRNNAISDTVTVTFSEGQFVSLVSFVFCNFTSTATMQIKLYTLAGDALPIYDTGAIECCVNSPFGIFGWGTEILGANAFSYGGGTYARVWLPEVVIAEKIEIIINDVNNTANYLEAGILVIGQYWTPTINAAYGAFSKELDYSNKLKNESGDTIVNIGPRGRVVSLNLERLDSPNRIKAMSMIKNNGQSNPLFLSLYPEDTDTSLEQDNQIYGTLFDGNVTNSYYNNFENSITIEEV